MRGASITLALFALCSFFLTLIAGTLSAFAVAFPQVFLPLFSFPTLRPLHTLFAFGWVIGGTVFVVHLALRQRPGNLTVFFLCSAFIAAAILLLSGNASGREYISWPMPVSGILVAGLLGASVSVLKSLPFAHSRNRDAAWMIGTGVLLLPLSLAETSLYLIPSIGSNIGMDIAVQWHSLDTMIGAWNLVLFGSVLLIKGNPPDEGKGGWWRMSLFIVAISGLLFTFGHHYYPSPQPLLMKNIAFYSSLLAAIAFLDHWIRRKEKVSSLNRSSALFVKFAFYWTLFSIATGFLMALPPVNVFTHGTYFVVAHAMGSMIGVNSMIILALIFSEASLNYKDFKYKILVPVRIFNGALFFMVMLLLVSGLAKGYWRLTSDFMEYSAHLRTLLSTLPLTGLVMVFSAIPVIIIGIRSIFSIVLIEEDSPGERDEEVTEYS